MNDYIASYKNISQAVPISKNDEQNFKTIEKTQKNNS